MQSLKIIRSATARANLGKSKTGLWEAQQKGLMVSSIKLGDRATGFLEHEIQAILAARAAGFDDDQLVKLVQSLESKRKEIVSGILADVNAAVDTEA